MNPYYDDASSAEIPEIELDIQVTEVRAKPRKLKTTWGPPAPPPRTPLQRLVENLEDPDYDPDDPDAEEKAEARYREKHMPEAVKDLRALWGSDLPTGLARAVSEELTAEIDREITSTLFGARDHFARGSSCAQQIDQVIKNALGAAAEGRLSPHLHDQILEALREPPAVPSSPILYNHKPC